MGFRFIIIKLFKHLLSQTFRFRQTLRFRRLRVGPLRSAHRPTINILLARRPDNIIKAAPATTRIPKIPVL
jgi:hypothetical protein